MFSKMNVALPASEIIKGKSKARSVLLSLFNRHLAYALAWLSGLDIFERTFYVDGAINVLRSAIAKGGIIFTDSHPFQHLLEPNAFKHRVICVTRILHLRSRTSRGPYNDVLAKVASVLQPSCCVLALGTWQLPITWAINALRANAIPAAGTVLSPLRPVPAHVWEDWVAAIARSPARPYCAILDPLPGLDVISIMFGVFHYWTLPPLVPTLPAPQPAEAPAELSEV
ncbi:MAG: hypothetical protein ACTS5R_01695 [Candidatus Hodgkinia cicadicola]